MFRSTKTMVAMKKIFILLKVVAVAMTSCEKADEGLLPTPELQPEVRKSLTTRSYDEALALAEESIALVDRGTTRAAGPRRIVGRGQCVTAPSKTRSGATDTLLYIFNFANDAGFSAIAASRAIEQPIMAVTECGNYTYGEPTGVENFDYYMDEMVNALFLVPIIPIDPTPPDSSQMLVETVRGITLQHEPMLTVSWTQTGPLGDYFANGVCGCVITAIAQIMSYHERPTSITTTYPYTIPHSGETIDLWWPQMKAYTDGSPASAIRTMLSALARDIGERVHADDSSPGSTGASPYYVPGCFADYGYTTGTLQNVVGNEGGIRMELKLGYPIYMRGDESGGGGHAWVADGVDYQQITYKYYEYDPITDEYTLVNTEDSSQNWIHYNWGWGPQYNGMFVLINEVTERKTGYTFADLQMIRSIRFNSFNN